MRTMMWVPTLLTALCFVSCASGQLSLANLFECGNPYGGTCRVQCQSGELSVFPAYCAIYSGFYGVNFQRCVTSMHIMQQQPDSADKRGNMRQQWRRLLHHY
nr:hypothetical protein BaRGS_021896 [Batillaria attramentaria]